VSRPPTSADKTTAVRTAIKASLSPREICRRYQISPATYFRIQAASVRDDASKESPRRSAPRPSTMQIERLCSVFPGLPVHEQTRVAADVRQAAQATLYSGARPRPTSVVIELENALAQARATPGTLISLSRRAWVLVGGDPEDEQRVLPRRKGRVDVLLAGLTLARDDVGETDDDRGGRKADPRLRAFVSSLGMIYESTAKKAVTYKTSSAAHSDASSSKRSVSSILKTRSQSVRSAPSSSTWRNSRRRPQSAAVHGPRRRHSSKLI
jgi:hypothetical protein